MKSVGKSLGVAGVFGRARAGRQGTGTGAGDGDGGGEGDSLLLYEATVDVLPPCEYPENGRLIAALGGLWALFLPHAAAAPVDSRG